MLSRAVQGASKRFRAVLDDPGAAQREHLEALLARSRGSHFGKEHGFSSVTDAADFMQQVPIRNYDELLPWIDAAAAGERQVLTEDPVVAFEETGGSHSGGKLVPYTAAGLGEFQAGLHAWLDDLCMAVPGLDDGSVYWSISPACRTPRTTRSGMPIGMVSDAAYFGVDVAPHILQSLAVPPEVGRCVDIDEWRHRTLTHLLGRADLRMISVWSPTFLTELLACARAEVGALARTLEPQRAECVRAALTQAPPDYARLWPRLVVISCWDQATSAGHAAALRTAFPGVRVQGKGLLATEGLVTIPLHDQPHPVLALRSGYFEFRDAAGAVRTAEALEDEGEYELVITNASGFYRYAIGDRVKVRGYAGRTPMLEFCGRGPGAVDLCGEKLSEDFVLRILAGQHLRFAALAADRLAMRYVLLVDVDEVAEDRVALLRRTTEQGLHRNPQYAHARSLGQLKPLAVARAVQPASRWTVLRLRRGQRLGDIKLPALMDAACLQQMLAP